MSAVRHGCDAALTPHEQALLARGIAQFNARLFFECHDTLEELWSGLRGDLRDFVQGMIQVAVGFYHIGNGNRAGSVRLFDRGLERLQRHPERCLGLETGPLRAAIVRWRDAAAAGGELPAEGPPSIAWAAGDRATTSPDGGRR